jgi:uncharacterized membrane protein HdeD (DUF308 family)
MGFQTTVGPTAEANPAAERTLQHEFQHLRSAWCWFFALGVLLVVCGTTAVIYPAVSSAAVILVLGLVLMVAGVATIIGAFWSGKWSGFMLELMAGIIYLAAGLVVREHPLISAFVMTLFFAVSFIAVGAFRILGALLLRFPQWGWALLNGVVTLLCGVVVYRDLSAGAFWIVGLLVGLEMLFNGWKWIMLAMAIKNIPKAQA